MGRFIKVFSSFSLITLISLLMVCPAFSFFEGSDDHNAWRDSIFGETSAVASLPDSSSEPESGTSEILSTSGFEQEKIYSLGSDQSEELLRGPILKAPQKGTYAESPFYHFMPNDIPFYLLNEQGFSAVYDIVVSILQGNSTWSMFINVLSNSSCRIYVGRYFTFSLLSNNSGPQRFVVGSPMAGTANIIPQFYVLTYNDSTKKFIDYKPTVMKGSTTGYNSNIVESDTSVNYSTKIYTVFGVSKSVFEGDTHRDFYYFGYTCNKQAVPTDWIDWSDMYVTENYQYSFYGFEYWASTSVPFYYYFGNFPQTGDNSIYLGTANYMPSFYFSDVQFAYNELQLEKPPETYNTDYNSFQTAIQDFITKTASFNSLMAQNRVTLKNNVKSYFDVFNELVPESLIIVLILLIIIIVSIGVFK